MAVYPDYFSKGLCTNYGNNRMPYQYSPDLRNVRIQNGVTIPRNGYKTSVYSTAGTTNRAITSNGGKLLSVYNSKLASVNLTTGVFSDIGSIGVDAETYFLNYGKYSIIFDGQLPYVYDGSSLSPIYSFYGGTIDNPTFSGTGSNNLTIVSGYDYDLGSGSTYQFKITGTGTPDRFQWRKNSGAWSSDQLMDTVPFFVGSVYELAIKFTSTTGHTVGDTWSIVTHGLDSASNPRFGTQFANFTWVAGGGSGSTSRRNILYVSAPITATSQQSSYQWLSTQPTFSGTGISTGASQIVMKSDISGLVSTLDRLFIFREGAIEWLNRSSYTTIGSIASFYTNPLAEGETIASPTSAIVTGDKLFFLTTTKKIKSINYVLGVDQVEIGDVSDDPVTGITAFMDSLHDDQSKAYGFYDSMNKQAKWFLRSANSAFNDLILIYDLVAKTFLVDSNKFYSCATTHINSVYCGSSINTSVYNDDVGGDDDGAQMSWYRRGAPISDARHGRYKIFMGAITSGTINGVTSIKKVISVDSMQVDQSTIAKTVSALGASVASNPVASAPVAGPMPTYQRTNFVKTRTDGYVNQVGRFLASDYSGTGFAQDFSLETLETVEKVTAYKELTDF